MKKLIICIMAVFAFTFASNAQTMQVSSKTTTKTSTKPASVKVKKKTTVKTGETESTTGVVLKKDGTPDKRYKKAKVLKKDGTPDMRYKVNQKTKTTTVN